MTQGRPIRSSPPWNSSLEPKDRKNEIAGATGPDQQQAPLAPLPHWGCSLTLGSAINKLRYCQQASIKKDGKVQGRHGFVCTEALQICKAEGTRRFELHL